MPTVAVIGAGFSGAVVAIHLLRHSINAPVRVVLVERSGGAGRGVAYGTTSPHHLLNVPAGRMSAFVGDEDSFLRFAQREDPGVVGGSFLPRRLYGAYVAAMLDQAERDAATHGASLERVAGTVVDIVQAREDRSVASEDAPLRVLLADGRSFDAERAVVALGNFTPANLPVAGVASERDSARYVRDPWATGALERVPTDAPVLLVGTGLTMLDVAMELAARERQAPLIALSRRGLVPLPHRPHGAPPSYGHLPPGLLACETTAVAYLRAIRQHARSIARDGIDWREVVASLRPVTPRLWETLPPTERARFLRHARPYWDVHRHRVAPALFQQFEALRASGALQLTAGRLLQLAEHAEGVAVTWRRRGASAPETLAVGAVVNCTGPEGDVRAAGEPLLDSLLARGVVRTDATGLGLDVAPDGRLLHNDGTPNAHLWLAGPLLKGTYWEATAVPELRVHASRAARSILTSLAATAALGN